MRTQTRDGVHDDTGGTITYLYNNADQLTALQLPGGNCTGRTWASPATAATGARQTIMRRPSTPVARQCGMTVIAGLGPGILNQIDLGSHPDGDRSLVAALTVLGAAVAAIRGRRPAAGGRENPNTR